MILWKIYISGPSHFSLCIFKRLHLETKRIQNIFLKHAKCKILRLHPFFYNLELFFSLYKKLKLAGNDASDTMTGKQIHALE